MIDCARCIPEDRAYVADVVNIDAGCHENSGCQSGVSKDYGCLKRRKYNSHCLYQSMEADLD